MAYTGTGTQADPYIPDTITSLYEVLDICNNDSSAATGQYYVKLESDIDCKDDPYYIGYMANPLKFTKKIAEFYSTNNKIIGLTIKSISFIDGDACHIHDIEFKNCFLKPPSNSAVFNRTTGSAYIVTDVIMSLYVISGAATALQSTNYVTLNNCSIYIDCGNSSGAFYTGLNGSNCNIIIDNCPYIVIGDTTASIIFNGSYCSVILKNSVLAPSSSYGYFHYTSVLYSYVCLLNTTCGSVFNASNRGSHNIVASNDYTNINHADTTDVVNYISIPDLQDNQKLIDLGFLP